MNFLKEFKIIAVRNLRELQENIDQQLNEIKNNTWVKQEVKQKEIKIGNMELKNTMNKMKNAI